MLKKEKILYYYLLIIPFIDFFSSIATWNDWPSIGIVIKGLFLVYATIFILKKNPKDILIIIPIIIYSIISIIINRNSSSLFQEISNLIKIFYLPTLIIFFSKCQNKYLNRQTVFIISLIYLLLYLIPYPFSLGHNIKEIYPNKDLYLSYFYVGNEIANIFILLIPISITYLIELKNKFYLIIYLILIILMLSLLGTKTMYFSVIIILAFLLYYYRKKVIPLLKKNIKVFSILIILILITIGLLLPKTNFYNNIKTSLSYYQISSITDLISLENVDNIIYSNRLDFLTNVNRVYMDSSIVRKLFGLGRGEILEIKDIEIDIFDIYYSIGLIGFMIYLSYLIYALKQKKLVLLYKFMFILLIIISFFSGHILISPMVSTYIALLFGLNMNEKGEKKYEIMDKKSTKKIKNCLNA